MLENVLVAPKNRRARLVRGNNAVIISLRFERFYDFMSKIIGGGNSYSPRETRW